MKDSDRRLNRERKTVLKMIDLYCHLQHETHAGELCRDCQDLAAYTVQRIDRCPFGAEKPTCANCPVHCYSPERREQIRQVMRFVGPRMLFHHPILTIMHLLDGLRKTPKQLNK